MKRLISAMVAIGALLGVLLPVSAQDTIMTVALPFWMEGQLVNEPGLIEDFEAQYGVDVEVVEMPNFFEAPQLTDDPEAYLDYMTEIASTADVFMVDSLSLTPEAVAAGNFLNLEPLALSSDVLNPDAYYPAALDAFRWDQGLWAIPYAFDVRLLMYVPDKFDAAGVPRPTSDWTMAELDAAIRGLTEFDANGDIVQSAMFGGGQDLTFLIRALSGASFYDPTTLPATPRFDDPALIAAVETMAALQSEGYLGGQQPRGDFNESALMLFPVWVAADFGQSFGLELDAVPLNVGGSGYASGFAVSSGTLYPELAYALAVNVAQWVEQNSGNPSTARRDVEMDTDNFFPEVSPELQAIQESAQGTAISLSEMRFEQYIQSALNTMMEDNIDAATALQEAQVQAQATLDLALERASTVQITVQPPDLLPELAQGEIGLRFGVGFFGLELPNEDLWEQLAEDFAAANPDIGYVELVTNYIPTREESDMDCFFRTFNEIPFMDLSTVLNLDPFIDADPNFDTTNVMGNVMDQVQREGSVWGYPLTMRPFVLRYDSQPFVDAGLPLPENGWSIGVFEETMRVLQSNLVDDEQSVLNVNGDSNLLLMLINAYGGLPIDYSQTPPVVNLTDPTNVEAVQRVLDLAIEGLLGYVPLTDAVSLPADTEGARFMLSVFMSDTLSSFSFRRFPGEGGPPSDFVTFPTGTRYTPVLYDISVAHINTTSQSPERCYEWISTLAQYPELFTEMPVFTSQLDSPALSAAVGEDIMQVYRDFADIITQPQALSVARGVGNYAGFVEQRWLFAVFDRYVYEDVDLVAELTQAEAFIAEFRTCAADIEEVDFSVASQEESEAYVEAHNICAMQVDPDWSDPFSNPGGMGGGGGGGG